jgi:4'-phosphopantetheinyl transferase EntD
MALHALAPVGVRVGHRRITTGDIADLRGVEVAYVRRAVVARQREFASGRALLREMIGYDGAIPAADDRSPLLPWGWRGSLAHDREFAIAAVSSERSVAALGIDIEPATVLGPEVAALVLRPDEAGLDAHLAFTMKEATYKAWSSLGGRLLDHEDIRLSATAATFRANVVPDRAFFAGTWVRAADRWIALVVVRQLDQTTS